MLKDNINIIFNHINSIISHTNVLMLFIQFIQFMSFIIKQQSYSEIVYWFAFFFQRRGRMKI